MEFEAVPHTSVILVNQIEIVHEVVEFPVQFVPAQIVVECLIQKHGVQRRRAQSGQIHTFQVE